MRRMYTATLCVLASAVLCLAEDGKPLLLRKPTVSRTQIVFSYAGDLWIVGREGGESRRLTTAPGEETDPVFSPDATQVAFTGEYDGNVDVYVVPAAGGVPRRLPPARLRSRPTVRALPTFPPCSGSEPGSDTVAARRSRSG